MDPTGITGSDIVCRLRQIRAGALAVTSPDMTAASGFAHTVVVVARTVGAVVDDKAKFSGWLVVVLFSYLLGPV
jgi:hypothetical protein